MVEDEIYCYVNGFFKWNISKKTSCIIGNKKFLERFAFLIWETKETVSFQLKVKEDHKGNRQDYN